MRMSGVRASGKRQVLVYTQLLHNCCLFAFWCTFFHSNLMFSSALHLIHLFHQSTYSSFARSFIVDDDVVVVGRIGGEGCATWRNKWDDSGVADFVWKIDCFSSLRKSVSFSYGMQKTWRRTSLPVLAAKRAGRERGGGGKRTHTDQINRRKRIKLNFSCGTPSNLYTFSHRANHRISVSVTHNALMRVYLCDADDARWCCW